MRSLLYVPILALLVLFSTMDVRGKTVPPRNATASRGHFSDAQIEQTIRTKLAKSKIGKDGLTAKVKNGVVTWEGNTNVMQHKGAATRMARTSGAVQVVNNIKISAEGRQKASGNLSGGIRRAQVKTN